MPAGSGAGGVRAGEVIRSVPAGLRRVVVVLLALLATLWVSAGYASAHASLVGTDPAYGASVAEAPAQVSVTFDESVTAADSGVTVVGTDGARVDTGGVSSADGGHTVRVGLPTELPVGTYLLSWVVLSADGHTIGGSSVFGVGVPPDLTLGDPPRDPLVAALDTVVRILTALGYFGVVLGVGVPAVAWLTWRAGVRTPIVVQSARTGAGLIAVTALLILAVTPARLIGASGWTDPAVWEQTFGSSPGVAALLRAAAAAALAIAYPRLRVAGPAAAVLLLATAAGGHGVAGADRVVALLSTTAHLAAMSVWVGGVVLAVVVWRDPERTRLLAGFGRVALGAVAVLLLTGTYQAIRSIDPLAALWTTSWGRLLLLKLALVLAAFGTVLVVRARAGTTALRAEFALQAAALVVTAALAGVTPARDSYDPPSTIVAAVGPLRATLAVDGAGAGEQELTLRLRDAQGNPTGAARVSARLTRGDTGPIDLPFRRVDPIELGPNYFVSQSVRVPTAGQWQLLLTVTVDRTTAYTATVPYRVW
ncbi:copper resistance protein CopC [Nocardia sp. NPDC050712]|uniref:copper resistance protein CopC n=1 Tax=Nocardia sp. NPDC050712 TaxID=3155518 RepID=UPI0033D02656